MSNNELKTYKTRSKAENSKKNPNKNLLDDENEEDESDQDYVPDENDPESEIDSADEKGESDDNLKNTSK